MKFKLNLHLTKALKMFILFISLVNFKSTLLIAEESYFNEIEIDSSTKLETNSSDYLLIPLK